MFKRIAVLFICVLGLIGAVGDAPSTKDAATNSETRASITGAPVETDVLVPVDTVISFTERSVNDPNAPAGTSRVTQVGVNGVKTSTYKVYYLDGVEQRRELVSETISQQPIEQITSVGTKVSTTSSNTPSANYYINVDGQKVQSPTYSSTVPSDATAQCRDGSYSYSQHRQGTCSGHGGVAQWL